MPSPGQTRLLLRRVSEGCGLLRDSRKLAVRLRLPAGDLASLELDRACGDIAAEAVLLFLELRPGELREGGLPDRARLSVDSRVQCARELRRVHNLTAFNDPRMKAFIRAMSAGEEQGLLPTESEVASLPAATDED
jgi:hypothetical protein